MSTALATISSPAPLPRLPRTSDLRARFLDLRAAVWYVADDTGIRSGTVEAVMGHVHQLDFDTALDLSQRYLEEADLAQAAGDEAAEEQWSTWAEQLQIWAAQRRPAPGRVVSLSIRREAVHACDQMPPFSEMTRRDRR